VFAIKGEDNDTYYQHIEAAVDHKPHITMDDGADVIGVLHSARREQLGDVIAGTEETTTGVIRLKALERDGALGFPVIAVNDANTKHLFDNRYGTGQSTVTAIMDATNLLVAGKRVAVVGYGWVGKGVARRARGLNARVIVCEVDPFAALEAYHDGFEVMPVADACDVADIVITATGTRDALPLAAIERLKNGAILANTGAVDDEFDVAKLRERALETRIVRTNVEEFVLDEQRSVFVVGAGVVVNLSAGEGHAIEIMDLTFALQALCARHLLVHAHELSPGVYPVPAEIDREVARGKLEALGLQIDRLTEAQEAFRRSWEAFA
jgi:adenosylhomocysteinase